ncbi:MAG TPA: hypothetical protein DCW45_08940 [Opitutae bacterium]|nr:hypothetical protein [Opitutae bacterium]
MFNFVFPKLKLSYRCYQKLHLDSIRNGLASKRVFETLLEVAGIGPVTPCPKNPVTMEDSDFSPESLTEILT